jgi:hypothetical protein
VVSVSILGRIGIPNKKSPGTRRDDGTDPQLLVSVPNTPGLNPRSLRSAYDVKPYVLLITICRIGILSLVPSLMFLKKSRQMPAPGFPFTPYNLIIH